MKRLLILLCLAWSSAAFADDRADIQAQIDLAASLGGGDVYLDSRVYVLSQTPGAYYSLVLPGNVNLIGAGRDKTLLSQAPGAGPSQRLVYAYGKTTISDLSLFGNRAYQTVDEHRAGLFVKDATQVTISRVDSYGFTGDGFVAYSGDNVTYDDVSAFDNGRNGLSLTPGGPPLSGVAILNSHFYGNTAQQIDSEPGPSALVSRVVVRGCVIDGTGNNDYALTVGGASTAGASSTWQISDNQITNGVIIVWANSVRFYNNNVVNATTKPAVTVYRSSHLVSVNGNYLYQTQTAAPNVGVIYVAGTGSGSMPSGITISENTVVTNPTNFGVRAEGVLDVLVLGNYIYGASYGAYFRTTNAAYPLKFVLFQGNFVSGFTVAGLYLAGNTNSVLTAATVANNLFDGLGVSMILGDSYQSTQSVVVSGNTCLGPAVCMSRLPPISRVF